MSDYYIIITDAGAALEAAAHAAGEPLVLTEFGVCDVGAEFTPDPAMTALPGEVYRGKISSLSVSADDENVLVAQCIIPAASGGYTIRGGGLYASDGTLYAVGNYPDQPKPAPDSGYAASLEVLVQLAVSGTADVTLNVTDGAWLTKAEGDQLYLEAEKNLSDLTDVSEAQNNLQLGALATKDSLTAAEVGAYPATGGNLSEEASVTVISNTKSGNTGDKLYSPMYRVTLKGRGGDQDFKDGASGLMRLVEEVGTKAYLQLQWDGFGSAYEFRFDQNGNTQIFGKAYTGSGASYLAEDGNVYGPAWGGWLSDWINAQIAALNNSINAAASAASDAQLNRVQAVQLGAAQDISNGNGNLSDQPGHVVTMGGDFGASNGSYRLRPLQYLINGQWVTAASV